MMLGNLSVEAIEERLGIQLTVEDAEALKATHQGPINTTPLGKGKWHCFDLPFLILTDTKETATWIAEIFQKYDTSTFRETMRLSWEKQVPR